MQLPAGVQKGLESAINRYLRLDPDSNARMAALDGRCICIELVGLDLQLFIHPGEQGIRLSDHLDAAAEPDTVLRGTPLGMARLGLGQDTEKTLFSGEVTITGDVETGQTFKGILDAMDVDWEEQLSKLTGDVIAHQLANGARRIGTLLKHGHRTLQQDIGEYLQEELRVLPARIETENFSSDITRISMDTDRLAARIRRQASMGNIAKIAHCSVEELNDVVEVLRKPGRAFLSPHGSTSLNSDSLIEISHEALIRIWERLYEWVNEEHDSIKMYLKLSEASSLYQQGRTELWKNPELQIAVNWRLRMLITPICKGGI